MTSEWTRPDPQEEKKPVGFLAGFLSRTGERQPGTYSEWLGQLLVRSPKEPLPLIDAREVAEDTTPDTYHRYWP